jgi:hypothetical protein
VRIVNVSDQDKVQASMALTISALKRLRIVRCGLSEAELVDAACAELERAGLAFTREVRLGAGCRIDITVGEPAVMIGVEAKKGRPRLPQAVAQVHKYAATGRLAGIIFFAERSIDLPEEIDGIPVASVSLMASLGIAL